MNFKYIYSLLIILLVLVSCDDSTGTLGVEIMPSSDVVTREYTTYGVSTESYAVGDSVLARSSVSYLGRFTDPETFTSIKCDFLSQFRCSDSSGFPTTIVGDSVSEVEVKLFFKSYVGDSLSSFKISIYELDKALDPNNDYYTNIDPTKYYNKNKAPLATKWYTLSDRTITDEERYSNKTNNVTNIKISLPNRVGNEILKGYRSDPKKFENTNTWANSGLPCSKGLYFKLESGDGAIAEIDICQLNIRFRYYSKTYEKDTTGVVQFAGTEEVVQATRFENSNLDKLISDKEATYIKCPAGVFTLATIPVESLLDTKHINDTINSAKLTFTRYNDKVQSSFKLGIPKNLLLLRLDDYLNGFFEKYLISDNQTSFLTTFNSTKNTYTYNNISSLITRMINEKKQGKATKNWNKVLLIPVQTIYDGSTEATLVKLNHDFSMSSTKLVGGKDKVTMEIIYTKFK